MASSRRTEGQGLTLGVPSETSARLGRIPRSFEKRPVHVPDLTGDDAKASGVVRLPLHLSWSGEDYAYDLSDRNDRARLYERVLVEGTEADIIFYVDHALLVDVWDEMVLPAHVREAWQSTVESQRR
jgi:hypothetical protein